MDGSTFYALLSLHKAEAAEGMAYFTAYSAVVLGILGYLGAVKNIVPKARIGIAVVFALFAALLIYAMQGPYAMHEAIHEEIDSYVSESPELVKTDAFRAQLVGKHLPPVSAFMAALAFFSVVNVAVILTFERMIKLPKLSMRSKE